MWAGRTLTLFILSESTNKHNSQQHSAGSNLATGASYQAPVETIFLNFISYSLLNITLNDSKMPLLYVSALLLKCHHIYLVIVVHDVGECGRDLPYELPRCTESIGRSSSVRWRGHRKRADDCGRHCRNCGASVCSSWRRRRSTAVAVVMAMVAVLLCRMQDDVVLPNTVLVPLSQLAANHSNSNHCSICTNHFKYLSTRL